MQHHAVLVDTDWHKGEYWIDSGKFSHIDGLVQERRNSIANTLELSLSCTKPSIYCNSNIRYWQQRVNYGEQDNTTQIAKFMRPTWGPPGSSRPQMGPMLAPWSLLSGYLFSSPFYRLFCISGLLNFFNKGFQLNNQKLHSQAVPQNPCFENMSNTHFFFFKSTVLIFFPQIFNNIVNFGTSLPTIVTEQLEPLSLTWMNFNPSMDE